jgi:pyruvate formate lyase activating enzyme
VPPTPATTLTRAREIGLREGLQYVYTGNVHDVEGGTTFCPGCGEELIVRDWHQILKYHMTGDGRCLSCGCRINGRFAPFDGQFGRRRIPVRLSTLR